jgi:hypothetical protein
MNKITETPKNTILRNVTPYSFAEVQRRFEGTYWLHLQCRRVSWATMDQDGRFSKGIQTRDLQIEKQETWSLVFAVVTLRGGTVSVCCVLHASFDTHSTVTMVTTYFGPINENSRAYLLLSFCHTVTRSPLNLLPISSVGYLSVKWVG